MVGVSIREIRSALENGSRDGFTLFNEIRNKENLTRVETNPIIRRMSDEIMEYADSIKDEVPEELSFELFMQYAKNGNRINYEKAYFSNKNELHALVMAEILKNDNEYIAAIEERLWKWCNTYTWELPAHVPLSPEDIEKYRIEADEVVALFSAETGFYFSEILSILKEKLHPLLVYRLEKEIKRRVIDSYKSRCFHWEGAAMNWASVCAGAVGCAAIYQIKDINELSIIIHRVIGTMESYLSGFDKDGITPEGLGYWNYGFSFYIYFAELLKERTNGALDLMTLDNIIRKISEMPLYLQFPSSLMVNFSDAPGCYWHGDYGLLSRLSKIFGVNEYKLPEDISIFSDHTSKWARLSRNIFWGLAAYDSSQYSPRTGCFYFPESQWIIDRRVGTQKEFYAFAAKGGNNNEPHNHNDLGHFILHYNGETLFCDLGAPEYVKEFFGKGRYDFLHSSSKGHSVPIINGEYQKAGAEYGAKVTAFSCENTTKFSLDLTKAFDASGLESFIREFIWDYNNLELEINDKFILNKSGNTIEETFITHFPVEVLEAGALLIKAQKSCVELHFDKKASVEVGEERYTNHFAEAETVNRVVIRYTTEPAEYNIRCKIKIIKELQD